MARIVTDICVIGAGSGGLSIAAGAVQMGARVVLVEGGEMGGDCLNTGCVPSKALLAAAKAAQAMRDGAGFGILPTQPTVDFRAVKDHVARVIATIAPMDSQARFERLGVQVIRDWGQFISPTELQAGTDVIVARRFVIATGSHALVPDIPGLNENPYFTNETIFGLRDRPDHLVIIGGGPIGIEMAQAHRRLGSQVTVIEGDRVLSHDDPDAVAVVIARLRAEGVTVLEGAAVTEVSAGVVVLKDGRRVAGSHLLLAIGRKVTLDQLGLTAAGVGFTAKGVTVDARLRSSNRRVYAVGDAAGGLQFTHVAGYHAGIVVRQVVLGLPAKVRTDHIPWVTYTDPELAQVGLTEAEAHNKHGAALVVQRVEYDQSDRAVTEGRTEGFLKVMIVKGRPVGATIVGHDAGELVHLWALAIAQRLKIRAIAGMVAPYPTYGDISKRAAGAYFSPKLFDSPMIKRVVRFVQHYLP